MAHLRSNCLDFHRATPTHAVLPRCLCTLARFVCFWPCVLARCASSFKLEPGLYIGWRLHNRITLWIRRDITWRISTCFKLLCHCLVWSMKTLTRFRGYSPYRHAVPEMRFKENMVYSSWCLQVAWSSSSAYKMPEQSFLQSWYVYYFRESFVESTVIPRCLVSFCFCTWIP